MRHIADWSSIPDSTEYNNPAPGGYIVQIVNVKDDESKEYLRIEWDYTAKPYVGYNRETHASFGFWPTVLIRSYKEKALPFFKGFKTSVEKSNPGYVFDDRNVMSLRGKIFGVVLGEEEYKKKNGDIGRRLYVHTVCSADTIRNNDFAVPELKELDRGQIRSSAPSSGFSEEYGDDSDLPWKSPFDD